MTRVNRKAVLVGAMALCLGLFTVLGGRGQGPAVDAKDVEQLVELDAKVIQAILAKPKFEMKAQAKVKAAALMIAAYAQSAATKDNGLKYFALRDHALKLAKAAGEGKADEAKKLAAELSVNMKADPSTKPMIIDLHKQSDLLTVMKQFSKERFGGYAIEEAIEALVDSKGPANDKEAAKIAMMATKVAMIGHLVKDYPQENQGKKTQKAWEEFAAAMEAAAMDLAKAAQARKDAEVGKLADRLTMTCVQCHDVFRIKE